MLDHHCSQKQLEKLDVTGLDNPSRVGWTAELLLRCCHACCLHHSNFNTCPGGHMWRPAVFPVQKGGH